MLEKKILNELKLLISYYLEKHESLREGNLFLFIVNCYGSGKLNMHKVMTNVLHSIAAVITPYQISIAKHNLQLAVIDEDVD